MAESDVEETTAVTDRPRASPWPVFVAFGLVLSELGVLFGYASVAVGGLALFAASVVGILRESGYAASLWGPALGTGAVLVTVGGLLDLVAGVGARATYVAGTGGLVLAVSAALYLYESGRL